MAIIERTNHSDLKLRQALAGAVLVGLLAACNRPGAETPTATPSSDQVLQTAQAIAEATLAAITPTATRVPPSDTPDVPTETPAPEVTATPSSPIITADYNANVRRGPGEGYEVLDVILLGAQANVVGRYDDSPIGTWWYIERIGDGRDGWVWSGAVSLSGNANGVPGLTPPPTSTPTEEPTDAPAPTEEPTAEPTATST